jgi:hypothetical protein
VVKDTTAPTTGGKATIPPNVQQQIDQFDNQIKVLDSKIKHDKQLLAKSHCIPYQAARPKGQTACQHAQQGSY